MRSYRQLTDSSMDSQVKMCAGLKPLPSTFEYFSIHSDILARNRSRTIIGQNQSDHVRNCYHDSSTRLLETFTSTKYYRGSKLHSKLAPTGWRGTQLTSVFVDFIVGFLSLSSFHCFLSLSNISVSVCWERFCSSCFTGLLMILIPNYQFLM